MHERNHQNSSDNSSAAWWRHDCRLNVVELPPNATVCESCGATKPVSAASVDRLRRARIVTFCREREEHGAWCGKTAEFILWGRLLPPESLGPRCYDHAAAHVGHRMLGDEASAIADLRPLIRESGGAL